MKIISKQLGIARYKRDLTLRELGRLASISAPSLSAIERGLSGPRPSTAKRLCEALEMDFGDLFTIAPR